MKGIPKIFVCIDFSILILNLCLVMEIEWKEILPHMSIFGTYCQNIPNQTSLREKKSIIIHDLNWCQKLPGIILVTSTNFIFKNILVKVPF